MSNQVVQRRVQIIIDESGAKPAYDRLLKQQEKLTKSISEGQKAGRDMTTELAKLEQVNGRVSELGNVISGKVAPSFRQTKQAVESLRKELALMSKDAPGYADKFKKFQEVSQTFDIMKGKVNGFRNAAKSVFSEIKSVALGVTVGNTITAITQSITGFIGNAISGAAKLSDEIADIEKATGLTTTQVEQLNSQIGKINTRTATSELRQIAIALGQAGESASIANIQALDQINVALGDEFGGDTRQIGNVLSVLRNNLQDLKTNDYAKDVTAIGNALNELGANGLATAPVVTDIANRIAGVAGTFGVTSGEILGTAASFQELGINVERGSTAYVKLLQKMASDTESFAQVAGLSVKDFEKLLNEDINEALLRVAAGTQQAAGSNVQFAAILKDLDADGSGASEMLSKLAANGTLVRQKIALASEALKNNNSILDEFNKKNTTLGAELDKLGKNIARAFSSSTLNAALKGLAEGLNNVLTPAKSAVDLFKEQQQTITKLEKDLPPLLKRYDELKAKTSLNKDEQVELNKTIQAIGATIPTAISQFDQYGRAIDINRQKAADFINTQRLILKERNRDAITEQKQLLKELEFEAQSQQRVLNAGKKTVISTGSSTGVGSERQVELSATEIQARQAQLQSLQQRIQGVKGIIDELTGNALQVPPPISADETKKSEDALKKLDNTYNSVVSDKKSKSKEEAERRKRELEALVKELQGIEQEIFLNNLDPYERRLQQLANKYSELFTKAGKDIELRDRILRDMLAQTQQLNAEFNKAVEDAELVVPGGEVATPQGPEKTIDLQGIRAEKIAQLELDILLATNEKKKDAQIALLKEQEAREIEALKIEQLNRTGSAENIGAQIALIEEKYRQKRGEAEDAFQDEQFAKIMQGLQMFLDGFQVVSDIMGGFEQARINRLQESYNTEKASLDKLFASKIISQEEYNRRSAGLDSKLQQEKAAIAKREHKRNQIINTTQVILDGVTAGVRLFKDLPIYAAIPAAILLAGQVAASIAKINSTPPPQFAKGGILPKGPSHAEGGIAVVSRGRKIAEIEGGEPIISKPVYRANKHLIDSLLAKGHAGDFSPLHPRWMTDMPPRFAFNKINSSLGRLPKYAAGGILPQQPQQSGEPDMQTQVMMALLNRLNQPIRTTLLYGEYEEVADNISLIRGAGAIS